MPHVAGLAGYAPPVSCHTFPAYDDHMDDMFAIYESSHFLWNCLPLEADQLLVAPTLHSCGLALESAQSAMAAHAIFSAVYKHADAHKRKVLC